MSCKTLFNTRLVNVAARRIKGSSRRMAGNSNQIQTEELSEPLPQNYLHSSPASLGAMSEFSSKSSGLGDLGSGAGQGGGDGGTIRSAGGSFGKREAAAEGEYFYKLQQKQLEEMKSTLSDELKFHKEQLQRHTDAITRINEKLKDQK